VVCDGQNRSQNIAVVLFYAVQSIDHINVIEQKFLEKRHRPTYMECDSMHSAIEFAQKNSSALCVSAWKPYLKWQGAKIHTKCTSWITPILLSAKCCVTTRSKTGKKCKRRYCELAENKGFLT